MQWIARVSKTHILIILITLITFISTFLFLNSLSEKISIAKLVNNVDSGVVLTKNDVEFVNVTKDDLIANHIITETDFSDGKFVARVDLSKDEILTKTNIIRSATPDGLQSMSIGIEINNANGGDIKKGDVIDIWQTGENARLVAQGISVRNIVEPDKRLGVSTTRTITLVLSINPDQAKNLSTVVNERNVMVVLSNGNSPKTSQNNITENQLQEFTPIDLNAG